MKHEKLHVARRRSQSLRYRLLTLVLVPLLLLSGTVILLAIKWSSDYTYEQLFNKVNTDLRVARDSFSKIQRSGQIELYWLANSVPLRQYLANDNLDGLLNLLEQRRQLAGFDFLKLWTDDGQSALHAGGWIGSDIRQSELTDKVITDSGQVSAQAEAVSGIEILYPEDWKREGVPEDTVLLPLVPTARAAPSDRKTEDRVMIIRTLQPVLDNQGRAVALLEAGLLLNRNFQFVDRIRDLVYGPGSLAPGSRGTVTVFLEDVRITTNVPASDDSRALGTRVSKEVRDAVLTRGESWVNRAFVVNDWYISAYEPIVDVAGERVGMLYAGYLEAPFREQLFKAIAVLSALVLAGSLLAGAAAILGARSIFRPIEAITAAVRATAQGKHQRIGPLRTNSEIGELAFQFDAMLDTLETHRQQIERDALMLEEKVQHRTLELETQNQRLKDSIDLLHQTRQRLATAERLAALGELTAGVAHEINNPTAVILGNMDVLSEELGDGRSNVQTEIDLIIEQVYRIRSITDRLLQYSRSSDLQPCPDLSPEPVSLAPLVNESLKLMDLQLEGREIVVRQKHETSLRAMIDRQELQQVLINLLSNAIDAMGKRGELVVNTSNSDNGYVRVLVKDTGCGIDAVHLARVFDPFFTQGKAQGTGLGLSVSYGIIRRFGGDISVSSLLGKGSEFTIELPAAPSCV